MTPRRSIAGWFPVRLCGHGGGGEVWLAVTADGRRGALKLLDRPGPTPAMRRKIRTAMTVDIRTAGCFDGTWYYVTDLADNASCVPGSYEPDTLEKRLRGGRFSPTDALRTARRIASGTAELHRRGFAHRDLKPANLLYFHGELKIGDLDLMCGVRTRSGAGTAGFRPARRCTARESDFYALGKLLYCMFTGLSAEAFPSLPPGLDPAAVRDLNAIALKCCAEQGAGYRDAENLLRDLDYAAVRRTRTAWKLAAAIAAGVLLMGASLWYFSGKVPAVPGPSPQCRARR